MYNNILMAFRVFSRELFANIRTEYCNQWSSIGGTDRVYFVELAIFSFNLMGTHQHL